MTSRILGSYNLPLRSLNAADLSPFFDADILEAQWKELEATFTKERIDAHELPGRDVYVICYNGDTARVATSVLRAKGIAAYSIKGGFTELRQVLPQLLQSDGDQQSFQQDWRKRSVVTTKELGVNPFSPEVRGCHDVTEVAV